MSTSVRKGVSALLSQLDSQQFRVRGQNRPEWAPQFAIFLPVEFTFNGTFEGEQS